jgi:phosphoglycerol transferase MdoB-like AlkP superfamily enzyme
MRPIYSCMPLERWKIKTFFTAKQSIMQIIKGYLKLLIVSYALVFVLRSLETFLVVFNYGWQPHLLCHEIAGIFIDLLIANSLFLVILPLYFLFYRMNVKLADYSYLFIIFIAAILHLGIIKYFVYQLIPLDIFLYQYSFGEIFFTVRSADIDYFSLIIAVALILSIGWILYKLLDGITLQKRLVIISGLFVILSFPLVVFGHSALLSLNKFSSNKSYYFVHRSLSWLLDRKKNHDIDHKVFKEFQQLFNDKKYIRRDYPLLHRFENKDILGAYFRKADIPPNIVILIIEGLNDDFIHPFKGSDLMPFMKDLKDKSLYWDHFFTTGERSFAVLPSILGALPYGEKGFTLLNDLPYHYTLVNILHMNDYHTSFFYGQSSWFHKKDRYFRFNNLDLMIDKDGFAEKYDKIIVGKDNFFWGYNDKDLFRQAFEVIDTFPGSLQKRLDIYFTGTSHSPFMISNQPYYDESFNKVIRILKNQEDIVFFNTYKKYIQTILFVDDAMRYFFETYQKRPEFENTIFIITGDHPMSEIPVKNSLKRFHVPLLIYSPLLKTSKVFHGMADFSDLYETILAYLSTNHSLSVPPVSTSLGSVLDTASTPQNRKFIAFMNDNRDIVDCYDNGYYISNASALYKITDNLDLVSVCDEKSMKRLTTRLDIFGKVSSSVSVNKKIIPEDMYFKYLNFEIYYSHADTSTIRTDSEYHDIVRKTKVGNRPFYFDISMKYNKTPDNTISIVYQLENSNDSVVLWRNFSFSEGGMQEHIKIDPPQQNDSVLYFKSFFWNTKLREIEYSRLETIVYGD